MTWKGERRRHGLAARGIKTSFARMRGHMHDRDETWRLREAYIKQYGFYDESHFIEWVYKNTGLVPYERSISQKADYFGKAHLGARGYKYNCDDVRAMTPEMVYEYVKRNTEEGLRNMGFTSRSLDVLYDRYDKIIADAKRVKR